MFYVTKCEDTPKLLGHPPINLPDHICSKHVIYSLTAGPKGPYTDSLCVFWELWCYHGEIVTRHADWAKERTLVKLFREAFLGRDPRTFPGVQLSDIPRLEQHFPLDINISEVNWIDGKSQPKIIL